MPINRRSTLDELLVWLDACEEARDWATGKTLAMAWRTCQRADWMLWLCAKMIGKRGWPTHKKIVLAACACAETALKFVPEGETRPAEAIRVTRAWARGGATLDEVRSASYAADAAYAANYAAYAAYAASSAAYAASSAAREKAHRKMCGIVRRMLVVPNAAGETGKAKGQ